MKPNYVTLEAVILYFSLEGIYKTEDLHVGLITIAVITNVIYVFYSWRFHDNRIIE